MYARALIVAAILPCAACSSIIEGTSQEIAVITNPPGASCYLMRDGQPIGSIYPTPGAVLIKKTKYDIIISCDRPGFLQMTYIDKSGTAGATAGNLVMGGAVGWAIDSASGADNKYDSPITLNLVPAQSSLPALAPTPAPTPAPAPPPAPIASAPPATTSAPAPNADAPPVPTVSESAPKG